MNNKDLFNHQLLLNKKKYRYPLLENSLDKFDLDEGIKVIRSGFLTMSKHTASFEKKFAKKLKVNYALMVNSGSSANLLATFASCNPWRKNRFKQGDEAIIQSLCWSTSLWPLVQAGLKVKLVDIKPDTLNVDVDEVISNVNSKTKVIMIINVLGLSGDLLRLQRFCKRKKIILIEDNCESLGAKYKNKCLGTFGDFGTFSFFYSHQITSGEGGMVTCNNPKDYEILFSLRSHGWLGGLMSYSRNMKTYNSYIKKNPNLDPRYIFTNSGFNLRPMDINASIGLNQFKKLDIFKKKRNKNRNLIIKSLKSSANWNNQFSFIEARNDLNPSWMVLPIIIKTKFKKIKKKFLNFLDKNGVETRPIISGSFNNQPAYKLYKFDKYNDKFFPNSQFIEDHGFVIGLHKHQMKKTNIEKLSRLMMKIDLIK